MRGLGDEDPEQEHRPEATEGTRQGVLSLGHDLGAVPGMARYS